MKVITTMNKLCLSCMEVHNVKEVEVEEEVIFKEQKVKYMATYEYCDKTEEFTETEEMIDGNDIKLKNAYRKIVGLLTSDEIVNIRDKYGVSQKDFSEILSWGRATITRYENHQVQDVAHDDFLKKIDSDPEWFLELLDRAKDRISEKAYNKYQERAKDIYNSIKNEYLVGYIRAVYAKIHDNLLVGCNALNINKIVDEVNYLAQKVQSLHKVKLMKMLWYSDTLSYKRRGFSITGLAYRALPMGAVPEGYEQIVLLEGVTYDNKLYGENIAYKFKPTKDYKIKFLSNDDMSIIDDVIEKFGGMKTEEIVDVMHEEVAYKETGANDLISYQFAEVLSIE